MATAFAALGVGTPSVPRAQDIEPRAYSNAPVDVRNSIKVYGSSGVSARTGNNYDLIGIAWQHRWGAGL